MKENKFPVYDPDVGQLTIAADEKGVARRFKATIPLKTGRDVVEIQGKPFITVPGMNKLNQVMGLTVLTPAFVYVDGQQRPNPYIERDSHGKPITVTVRKVAIGNTPMGQLVATDYVLNYSRASLLLQSLAKVAQYHPGVVFLGTEDDDPAKRQYEIETTVWKTVDKKRTKTQQKVKVGGEGHWRYFPIDEFMGYWADLSRSAVQEMMKDYVQVLSTFERRAQSIAERNAIAHHPACGGAYADVTKDGQYVKTVYGVRYEQDPAHLKDQIKALQTGAAIEDVLDAEVTHAEVKHVVETPEMAAAEAMTVAPEDDELGSIMGGDEDAEQGTD